MVMAERRKGKKKKDLEALEEKKLTKEEYAVARHLKQKLPEKKTTLAGHKVEYFIASKAVDCLLESKWAKNDKKSEVHFHNRDSVVHFMERLLVHKLFHRAKKIVVQKEQKKKKDEGAESSKEKEKEKEPKKQTEKSSETGEKKKEKKGKKDSSQLEKKKEKKKIKLDMHLDQTFVDMNEPYVWMYDPIPLRTWVTGALMVLAAVLISLFPLWPQTIRHYIYYLSVAAAFFLVFIIGLAVFRLVIFVVVWLVTFGKHHIWILPNLTEDVGFFESFWPLYKYEYKGKVKDADGDSSEDKKHKDKESGEKSDDSSSDQEKKKGANNSESEESGDEKQKGENDFEMINADDMTNSDNEEEDPKTK